MTKRLCTDPAVVEAAASLLAAINSGHEAIRGDRKGVLEEIAFRARSGNDHRTEFDVSKFGHVPQGYSGVNWSVEDVDDANDLVHLCLPPYDSVGGWEGALLVVLGGDAQEEDAVALMTHVVAVSN